MEKKRKFVFEDVPDERTLTTLKDGTRLEWVPTWEGVLMYAPEDLKMDRPVRIWHVITRKSKRHGVQRIRYELKPRLDSCIYKKNNPDNLRPRCRYSFSHHGRKVDLYRYHATLLAYFGFEPVNPRLWVADHYDKNTLNDRISNLSYITQRENIRRSKEYCANQRLCIAERKRRAQIRIAWREQMRPHVIAALGPGATAIDVEMELTQLLIDLTPDPSPKGEGSRNT